MRYQFAAGKIDESVFDRFECIIFAGFFALTKAEKTLFKKLFPSDNTVFIFQEGVGLYEKLKDLGITCESGGKGAVEPEIHFYSSPDTHGQVLALGKILGTKLETGDPLDEKTVIVLPSSETLFPLVRQGLSIVPEDAYNVSLGYPLHRTPVFGFLNNLMELVNSMDGDRIYIPDYLKFVLHPYTKNIYFRASPKLQGYCSMQLRKSFKHKAKTTTLPDRGERGFFKDVIRKIPKDEHMISEGS
jgi:hypothetical protein